MPPQWFVIACAILVHSAVFAGFVAVSLHWWQCERLQKREARRPLRRLRWIFLTLAAAAASPLIPNRLAREILLVPLAWLLWAYLLRAGSYLVIILDLPDGKRMRDELAKAQEREKK